MCAATFWLCLQPHEVPPPPPFPSLLPADDNHSDIPVPDFTYYCYPEARYNNSSWPAIQVRSGAGQGSPCWPARHAGVPAIGSPPAVTPLACLRLPPPVQALLQHKSDMVAWHERHSELFHRSNWAVGPRRVLMPLLQAYDNGTGDCSSVRAAARMYGAAAPAPCGRRPGGLPGCRPGEGQGCM